MLLQMSQSNQMNPEAVKTISLGIPAEYTDFREVFRDLAINKAKLYRRFSKDKQQMRKFDALFSIFRRAFDEHISENVDMIDAWKNDFELYTV